MVSKCCSNCGALFLVRPQVPNQTYCSSPDCQRARKQRWQQVKLQTDPDYQSNQRAAQRAWQERNQDYWRKYRDTHPEYAERNRKRQRKENQNGQSNEIAKKDECPMPSGFYHIKIIKKPAQGDDVVWFVEITAAQPPLPCK